MVIRYFNIVGIAVGESKAYPPLIVDGDGMPPFPIPGQGVQPIAGRNFEIGQARRHVYIIQSPQSPADQIRRQSFGFARNEQPLGFFVRKGLDHGKDGNLSRCSCQSALDFGTLSRRR